MNILFLDIDGVLNNHAKLNGSVYCSVQPHCMAELNRVLAATKAGIVLSSSWRYMIIGKEMTVKGFYYMLCTHGLLGELVGIVCPDEEEPVRGKQITRWLDCQPSRDRKYAVVDDLDLGITTEGHPFVQTEGNVGLTREKADQLIGLLT